MRIIKTLSILFCLIIVISCNQKATEEEQPLAKVHNKYLYPSDIKKLFYEDMSKEDSISLAGTVINEWVKKQLMLRKAELNLTEEDTDDIEKQIEDYRTSLMIFKYSQQLTNQRLDTVVTEQEIEEYYQEYSSNFILKNHLAKALYIKLPQGTPEINNFKNWYKSDDEEDISRLEDYCYQYAIKYDDFKNDWIEFSSLLTEIPLQLPDKERFLRYQKYIETEDSLYQYFVRIKDYRLKSTVQPLDYANNSIKTIILNKRKFKYLENLELRIYNDALNHNEFVIY